MSEAEPVDVAAEPFRANPETRLDRADVAGFHNDVFEREHAVRVDVADLAPGEGDEPWGAIDQVTGLKNALLDSRRCRDELEGRAGLVGVLNDPVPPRVIGRLVEDVRIERRVVRQREDLTRARIHDDGGASGRVVLLDARPQLPLDDVLEVLIDRELDRVTGRSRPLLARATRVAPRVHLEDQQAFLASNAAIVCRFDTAQTDVAGTDEPERVCKEGSVRVVAPALFVEHDAGQFQPGNARGSFR